MQYLKDLVYEIKSITSISFFISTLLFSISSLCFWERPLSIVGATTAASYAKRWAIEDYWTLK